MADWSLISCVELGFDLAEATKRVKSFEPFFLTLANHVCKDKGSTLSIRST